MRVGSSPMSSGSISWIAPMTARVCHSSVASPQPHSPGWSVTTFTKIQLRMRALHTCVSIRVIFTRPLLPLLVSPLFGVGTGKSCFVVWPPTELSPDTYAAEGSA